MYFLHRLFQKRKTEQQLDSELAFHLEQRTQDLRRRGMSPEEARRAAQIELGGFEAVKEQCRESRRAHLVETFLQDFRYGLRLIRRNPGFAAAAILTLALGIGASTAVFSVVNSVLLRPLAFPEAQRIVIPWRQAPSQLNLGVAEFPWGQDDFEIMAADVKAIDSLSAFLSDSFSLTGKGDPQFLDGLRASAGFFDALGVKPELGRTFTRQEDTPGHEHEVVLSYGLWRSKFAGSREVLGQSIELNETPYTVIGVMPRGFVFPKAVEMPSSFNFPAQTALWVPLALPPGPQPRDQPSLLAVIGRLHPGNTMEQAQAELNVFAKRRESVFGKLGKDWFNSRLVSLPRQTGGNVRAPLLLILGAVGVVLLLACSNVAGLLLARSLSRTREFSMRLALGAAHGRLIRQLLTESLVLAGFGGVLGAILAEMLVKLVKTLGPADIPRLQEVTLDPRVAFFALGATLLTGMLFGLAPSFAARSEALLNAMKQGGARSAGSGASPRARRVILVAQMAMAVVLVVAAGLLAKTFAHLLTVDPGFNAERVLTFELSLPPAKYPGQPAIVAFYQRLLPQLQDVPGVQSAALVETAPMGGNTESSGIRLPGRVVTSVKEQPFANYSIVSPRYFATVQTPLLRGREFLDSDTTDSTPVVIINHAMAEKYWPGEDPLGKQFGLGSTRYPLMVIVGICADEKHISLRDEPMPEMFVPYTQKPYPTMQTMALVVRAKGEPSSVTGGVQQAIQSLDRDLPLAKITTLHALVRGALAQPRFAMLLLAGFAAIAVMLAAIGIYGVIAFSVSQRTQEIGIRMALGAKRANIFAMVVSQGLGLSGLGILLGLMAALGATRLMASYLYGVRAIDPVTFTAVAAFLVAVTFAACYFPARRATAVQPTQALRNE